MMETLHEGRGTSFACDEVASTLELQACRNSLEELVRDYGEVLSLFSFIHLGSTVHGLGVLTTNLQARAAELLVIAMAQLKRTRAASGFHHARKHLGAADSALAAVNRMVGQRTLLSDPKLLRFLSAASQDLKAASRLLGTTTFDASACCASSLLLTGTGVEKNGRAFRLGS